MKKQPWKKWVHSSVLALVLLGSGQVAAAQTSYTVQKGDTLYLISQRFGVPVAELKEANRLTSDEIWIGHILTIPEKTVTYTVKSGDVLWKIAQNFGTTIEAIVQTNQLASTQLLVGQTLKIPQNSQALPESGTHAYTVKSGDMLWKIAMNFNTTIEAIKAANGLGSDTIHVGQQLIIPSSNQPSGPWVEYRTYTVQKGDTGWSISIKFGIPFAEFLKQNQLTESSYLSIGQQVIIPIHHVPVKPAASPTAGELLDWWTEAQYVFPISAVAKVTDVQTGQTWNIKRTIGAFHADCEPLTAQDAAIMKNVWGGTYSWTVRPVIVEVNGRRLAASASSMPHDIAYISENDFDGHFDIHFLNSTRHKDSRVAYDHQEAIKVAAELSSK